MQKFCYTRHQTKETLIDFLTRRFPYQSRESWLKSIKLGAIKLNSQVSEPSCVLASKDVISYERLRSDEPKVDTTYNILFSDPVILVVEKNGNIPIAESGRYYRNTLINILKEEEGLKELYAVHRLDKETSGVLLISRTKEVATILGQQFVKQIPQKTYHAILKGEVAEPSVLVDQPIGKCTEEQSRIRIRQVVRSDGKPSKSHFQRVKVSDGLTLVKVQTFSGRTHQIRCHAEFLGHPIIGDKLYGQEDDRFLEFLNGTGEPLFPPFGKIERQLLHASSLSFHHPVSGEEMRFESDFYPEFSRFEAIKDWLDRQ